MIGSSPCDFLSFWSVFPYRFFENFNLEKSEVCSKFVPKSSYISSRVTSVNLKKAGMASRNTVIKNNTRCIKSALQ